MALFGRPLTTGRENDGTGLYYYRTRYYSPALARFISEDLAGFLGGANLYAYVGNNPCSFVDPLGLVRCQLQQFTSDITRGNQAFTAADLNEAVRVVFGESTPTGARPISRQVFGYKGLDLGTRPTDVGGATLDLEAMAIADTIFNRVGNTEFGRFGRDLKSVLVKSQFDAVGNRRYTAAKQNTLTKGRGGRDSCADYQRAFNAVREAATNGPRFPYTFFVAVAQPTKQGTTYIRHLDLDWETSIGNSDFSRRRFGSFKPPP